MTNIFQYEAYLTPLRSRNVKSSFVDVVHTIISYFFHFKLFIIVSSDYYLPRRIEYILPTAVPLLKSYVEENTLVKMECRQKNRLKIATNMLRKKKPLQSLRPGNDIMMQNRSEQWTKEFV